MRVVGVVLWFVASLRVASDRSSAPRSRRQFRSCAPPPQASLSPVDHPRGLLFASITVGSADGPYGLLFLHCHWSGRPPQRVIILIDRYSISRWGQLFIILLSGWTRPTTPGDYYLPPSLWDRLMVPMDYYFSIAIDPADHLRGLLSSLIGPYWLLSAHCHGSGRPVGFYYFCW